ncbi:MAG: bile acid:sodium symporter [Spirochaetes bacterium]|nr:bile acid:sodium symporter [Spirochaetota bacterium]
MKNKSIIISGGVYCAIAAGIIFDSVPHVKMMIPYLLSILLFLNFLRIDFSFRHFLRKELIIFPFFYIVIFPAAVFILSAGMDPSLRAGVFIITVTPAAIGAPVVAMLIGADRGLVMSHVIVSNLIAPVIYPLMLFLYFRKTGLDIQPADIFRQIVFIILVPLIVSSVFKKTGLMRREFSKISGNIVPAVFIFMVFAAVTASSKQIKSVSPSELVNISIFVFSAGLFFFSTGLVVFRKNEMRKSAALSLGHKNTGLAIWVAVSNFPAESVLPLIIYIMVHHFFNGILIFLSERSFLYSGDNPDSVK